MGIAGEITVYNKLIFRDSMLVNTAALHCPGCN